MALSRFRIRLAVRFAIAFLAGLTILDLSLFLYLRVSANQRLTASLHSTADALVRAVNLELEETPDAGLPSVSREAMREWPVTTGGFAVLDSSGAVLVESGPAAWLDASRRAPFDADVADLQGGADDPIRRVVKWREGTPRFGVVVLGSSEATDEQVKSLAFWLALSAPLVLLLGFAGGYVLSRGALAPIDRLREAIGQISPHSLGDRLEVSPAGDELDQLARQFNGLLDRLEASQDQNRRFLRMVAHQIRTPLTLVVGEASLELQRQPGANAPVLQRIRVAGEQMQRRVNDLFLLAEARAGGVPPLDERVEMDGLLFEAADVMRGRAQQLGRKLELGQVQPGVVRGSRALLQEAVMELIENALRHGTAGVPVGLSTAPSHDRVLLRVESGGEPLPIPLATVDPLDHEGEHGLGLPIVQWIAGLHGGGLEADRVGAENRVTLSLPAAGGRSHGA